MNAMPASPVDAGPRPSAAPAPTRRMVDAPTRAFHWLFALSFLGAYLTGDADDWRPVHVTLGYTMAGLIAFRLLWGVFGPRHARLSAWISRMRSLPAALRSFVTNPLKLAALRPALGAAAVVGLVGLAVATTASGWTLYDGAMGGMLEEALEEVHEALGNAMLAVVLAHVALVLGGSLLPGHHPVRAMVFGRIPGSGPDLARHNRPVLAALLIAAVPAFWTWQWQTWPADGEKATASHQRAERTARHGDPDDD